MLKEFQKVVYGEEKGQAFIDFKSKIDKLIQSNKAYLEDNNIKLDEIYTINYSYSYVNFKILNQTVLDSDLGKEMDKVFTECFSELFKKD